MPTGLELKDTSEPPSLEYVETEDRVEAMVEWFYENFEDPAQRTPYETSEGGYQYIWGGPYDAQEEIGLAFPDATDEEIQAAVDEVQSDGLYDWAPSDTRIQADGVDDDETDAEALEDRIASLRGELDALKLHIETLTNLVPQMGHNRPPEEMRLGLDTRELNEAKESVEEIKAELDKPNPLDDADSTLIQKAEGRFRALARKVFGWAKAAGTVLALGVVGAMGTELWGDPQAFVQKLEAVANTLQAWVSHLDSPF